MNDRIRKRTGVGPHRDELSFWLDGRMARQHASQGQHRILALAIKLAELECVRAARGAHPLLLLDDVSSELDPERTGSVYEFLRDVPSQVFVTTTRPDLLLTPMTNPSERADFEVRKGKLRPIRTAPNG
jgi:DNA replication and repair protein RecF